jgi:hypothetical protein
MSDAVINSTLSDIHDVPLAVDVTIDDGEYAEIMRYIVDDNSVTPVSAFNSTI